MKTMTFETIKGLVDRPPLIETLLQNTAAKIDHIRVNGQITPAGEFPDEPSYEFIQVISGTLVLEYKSGREAIHSSAKPDGMFVKLGPGDYAIKSPKQRTRADHVSENEELSYIKVSFGGRKGRYPQFTGAVGADEVHGSVTKPK
jgi:hypothetical protein